jgi:hypothetical protein
MVITINPAPMFQYFADTVTTILPILWPFFGVFLAVALVAGILSYLRSKAAS